MNLTVFGATGGTGQALVRQALARGDNVTALVLPGTEIETRHARLRVLFGDARDVQTASLAVTGADAVLSALGAAGWARTTVCVDATRSILAAMKVRGVRRLVCITSAGVTSRMGFVYGRVVTPLFLRHIYSDKRSQEDQIRSSSLDWVIVRPVRLFDGPKTGAYEAVLDGDVPGWRIARANVADFMLRQTDGDRFVRSAPIVAEPSLLKPV